MKSCDGSSFGISVPNHLAVERWKVHQLLQTLDVVAAPEATDIFLHAQVALAEISERATLQALGKMGRAHGACMGRKVSGCDHGG